MADTEQHTDLFFLPPMVPPELADGDLLLRLRELRPANPAARWASTMIFDMIERGSNQTVGGIHLRLGETEDLLLHGGQIGYAVDPEFRGRRYAARSVRLLLPIARQAGMKTLWITCDPTNIASRRTLEIAGGDLVETRDIAPWSRMYAEGRRQICRFRFDLTGNT